MSTPTRFLPSAIGHVDADSFYVSAERVRDSFLLGKPVGVLGNQLVICLNHEGPEPIGRIVPRKIPSLRDIHQAAVPIPKAGTLFLIASVIYVDMP